MTPEFGRAKVGLRRGEAMAKVKKAVFSTVKAVKSNSRDRLGTPPPVVVIPDDRHKAEHGPVKHKRPLAAVLAEAKRAEEVGEL